MIIHANQEVNLYARKTAELPYILKNWLQKIQLIYQPDNIYAPDNIFLFKKYSDKLTKTTSKKVNSYLKKR